MRHTVLAEVAPFRFVDERQRALAHPAQFCQHLVFFSRDFTVNRDWRFEPHEPGFNERYRNMKSLPKGLRRWWLLQQAIEAAQNPSFRCHQMARKFTR